MITLSLFGSSAAYHYQPMEPRKSSSLLTKVAEELILDAQGTLIHVILRAEDALYNFTDIPASISVTERRNLLRLENGGGYFGTSGFRLVGTGVTLENGKSLLFPKI
jgi:hypothetical protein